jgi:ABC-type molybdate transport system substrate-binding protein
MRVDASLHAPLEQVVATCRRGTRAADGLRFIDFLQRPESRAELTKRGFELP